MRQRRDPLSPGLPPRPGGVYAKPLVPDHRPRLGGPPFFARGLIPSSAWSVSGSRRTSSVGRGCEALPLWPRWERRGDSSTLKMRSPAGFTPRRWSRAFLLKQVVVGLSFLLPPFTWLILPVVICLSQRLSHASVSKAFSIFLGSSLVVTNQSSRSKKLAKGYAVSRTAVYEAINVVEFEALEGTE